MASDVYRFERSRSQRPALIDAESGAVTTFADLADLSAQVAELLPERALVMLRADMSVHSLALFRALTLAGHPIALLDAQLAEDFTAHLLELYRPAIVVAPLGAAGPEGMDEVRPGVWVRPGETGPPTHPDLAILLTTSGSTGSPKFVRLSRQNIEANTTAIIESMGLREDDRALATLPLFYSYGMSVLNTHLAVGGALVVSRASVIEPTFWTHLADHEITFVHGVPATYGMLRRVGLSERAPASLRALTQAGGRLADDLIDFFAGVMGERDGQMLVMYGQTEAAPRISCRDVTADRGNVGSVGPPLRGGRIRIVDDHGLDVPTGGPGEVRYEGPNVMMGYATGPSDLALGDTHGGVLATGDVGYLDAAGELHLTGRLRRIAKVAGMRVSLDEIEALLAGHGGLVAAVSAGDDGVIVHCEWGEEVDLAAEQKALGRHLKLPPKSVILRRVDHLPVLGNGKIDYRQLQARGAS